MTTRSAQKQTRTLQLVLLSDTHEQHTEAEIPYGQILIHAGDFTMLGGNLRSILDFDRWLTELPHRWKLVCGGNHDSFLQSDPASRSLFRHASVLINEGMEIEGLRVWASPVNRSGPAFCVRSDDERRRVYAGIPTGTDILITHEPPFGVLDCSVGSNHQGDPVLREAVMRLRPKLHIFGHVHLDRDSPRVYQTEDTTFVNAALLGPAGEIDKKPIVLRMDRL